MSKYNISSECIALSPNAASFNVKVERLCREDSCVLAWNCSRFVGEYNVIITALDNYSLSIKSQIVHNNSPCSKDSDPEKHKLCISHCKKRAAVIFSTKKS